MKHALALLLALMATPAMAQPVVPTRHATLYAGQATRNTIDDIATGSLDREDTYLAALGYGQELHRFNDNLGLEAEGSLVQYIGGQHNHEINGGLMARWHTFPWNNKLRTTAAIGLGLSHAFGSDSRFERRLSGTTARTLTYLPIELTAAKPGSTWEGVARIHHRSTAYGTFNEEGGANHLTFGLRKRF